MTTSTLDPERVRNVTKNKPPSGRLGWRKHPDDNTGNEFEDSLWDPPPRKKKN